MANQQEPIGSEQMQQLVAQVQDIRSNNVAPATRQLYRRSMLRFLSWLLPNKPNLLPDEFLQGAAGKTGKALTDFVGTYLDPPMNLERPPLKFHELKAGDFFTWIVSLPASDGATMIGKSSLSTHRSALYNLFRDYHQVYGKELESELSNHTTGMKRKIASEQSQGQGEIKVGKDPFDLSTYRRLALSFLQQKDPKFLFAHILLTLSWNLMCRVSNGVSVCVNHLTWTEDALGVYFAHQKNDQTGERPKDPRHVYANPECAEICSITSLGLYWMMFPINPNDKHLFPGQSQEDRFRTLLHNHCIKFIFS